MGIPKVNPLHALPRRARLKKEYRVLRPNVRRDTHCRDGMRCRACSKLLPLKADTPLGHAHIHEMRGGVHRAEEAIDVTLRSTITLCSGCHAHIKDKKLKLDVVDEAEGFNGLVLITGRLANGDKVDGWESRPTLTPVEARTP